MRQEVLLLGVLCALSVRVASAPAGDKYSSRFESLDVDAILQSERLVQNYFKCLMDRGPCTREGTELKTVIPEALVTECAKCSDIQKKQAGKVMAFVQLKHPDMWEQVLDKYDPEGNFRKKYGYNEDDEEDEEK
ncbi:hypothetical protein C0J52_25412 [Blattella germanica]|uniref:Chemosensory protein n=1 Tax=Blattella germanica TaxID=6973 RepID=A0A0X8DBL2_BLAGE|nr:chemosensory protein [Blattella germanica]PSN33545.1 hypothetical protein C0J52_25412 [Blattella germanica]